MSSVRCGWSDCNARFVARGNQRYCSKACSCQARRVQNRRAQRRRRLRRHLEASGEAVGRLMTGPRVSAVRTFFRGDLPMRLLPPQDPATPETADGLLLRHVPK